MSRSRLSWRISLWSVFWKYAELWERPAWPRSGPWQEVGVLLRLGVQRISHLRCMEGQRSL